MRNVRNRKELVQLLPKDAVVAEVGVQRGRFAKTIFRKAKPKRLHLIDCWEHQHDESYEADGANVSNQRHQQNYDRVLQRLARGVRRGQVELHKGYSVPVLASFPDEYFDWVYVDANHTYEAVTSDLEACLPKIRPGGIIAGHDYINTPFWQERHYGVVEAVDAFCERHGWEIVYLTDEPGNDVGKGNPSYAIREAGQPPLAVSSSWWWPKWQAA